MKRFTLVSAMLFSLYFVIALRTANGHTLFQEPRLTEPAGDCLPAITVTNTADSGPGSLRQAILDLCPAGSIDFDLPLPAVMTLTSGELLIDKGCVSFQLKVTPLRVIVHTLGLY